MKLTSIVTALALVTALGASSAFAQSSQQTPPPKPDPKAEPKPEQKPDPKTTVAGKWNVFVDTQQGELASTVDLKLEGKKVTGTMSSTRGDSTVEGEFVDGKLTFAISFAGTNGSTQITFTGALKADGTMAGTMDFGQGQLTWRGERPKEKS